jgi:hypothetical protein
VGYRGGEEEEWEEGEDREGCSGDRSGEVIVRRYSRELCKISWHE